MNWLPESAPILTSGENARWEQKLFRGDEDREWAAMQAAGQAVARGVRADFPEIGPWPRAARILVLVGKGHNGGDALIAARAVLEAAPDATAEVVFAFGARGLRPLAWRAYVELQHAGGDRVTTRRGGARPAAYALALDGVFGFSFRPPLPRAVAALFARVNLWPIQLRAAVDLPSGLGAAQALRADFTYATGSVKSGVPGAPPAGRVRYLDLGFFPAGSRPSARERVLTPALLRPLAALRPPHSDKRRYGHVLVIGGSRGYPGAVLMSALAALHSGAGLVTAFAPASLVPAYAARAPEVMWVAWPEGPGGNLAPAGAALVRERWERADALVIGPGLGRNAETAAALNSLIAEATRPLVLDADALQPANVAAARGPLVVTPHAGEFERLNPGGLSLRDYSRKTAAVVVLKGPLTQICAGGPVHCSFQGGPVLARGGSGDLLSGLAGGLLARMPAEPLRAAASAVVWHGRAADLLARARGQTAVAVTQLLDFLPAALRESADEP